MRPATVTVIVAVLWLAAGAAGVATVCVLGSTQVAYATLAVVLAIAVFATVSLGYEAQRRAGRRFEALRRQASVPAAPSEEAVVRALQDRLDLAAVHKTALLALRHPALLASTDGEVIAITRGLAELVPEVSPGRNLDVVFGAGFLAQGGGLAQEMLVRVGGTRFLARSTPLGEGLWLVDLDERSLRVAEDDLEAFVTALEAGETGFRFTIVPGTNAAPVHEALNAGMAAVGRSAELLTGLADGIADEAALARNDGLSAEIRAVHQAMQRVAAERDHEMEHRIVLEDKVHEIGQLVLRYADRTDTLVIDAAAARHATIEAASLLRDGKSAADRAIATGAGTRTAIGDVQRVAHRTAEAVGDVDAVTADIDRLVAGIESVAQRTGMLALNAAVEAARAGERGAGFSVVAEEVRNLSQATSDAIRQVRALVQRGRAQAAAGSGEADTLRDLATDLTRHLQILSEDAETIGGALGAGSAAIASLDDRISALGQAAGDTAAMAREAAA